ncbi:unnamed protein product, partial [Allacma fusca]
MIIIPARSPSFSPVLWPLKEFLKNQTNSNKMGGMESKLADAIMTSHENVVILLSLVIGLVVVVVVLLGVAVGICLCGTCVRLPPKDFGGHHRLYYREGNKL